MITEKEFKHIIEAVRYCYAQQIEHMCKEAAADAMLKILTRNSEVVNTMREILREEATVIINAKLQNVKAVIKCE